MTMQQDLLELATIKARIEALAEAKAEVEERLIAAMSSKGQKTVTVSAQDGDIKGTLVAGTRIIIDEEKLRGALTAAQWKKVSKSVLDKEKLEAHMVTGDVDPNIVASASTEKDVKPYIRVSGSLAINVTDSKGHTKPAAKKRVVRPAKPKA